MSRLRRFFSRWQNGVASLLILVYVFFAVGAPYLSPDDPKNPGPFMTVGRRAELRPIPPNEKALLGMLPNGIDVYHALVWGARDALQFGLIVTLSTAVFGILYGAVAGLAGERVSVLMLRIADAFLAFPPIAGLVFLQQLFAVTVTAFGGFYFVHETWGKIVDVEGPMTLIQYLKE